MGPAGAQRQQMQDLESKSLEWSVGETGVWQDQSVLGDGQGAWGHRARQQAWHTAPETQVVVSTRQVGLA